MTMSKPQFKPTEKSKSSSTAFYAPTTKPRNSFASCKPGSFARKQRHQNEKRPSFEQLYTERSHKTVTGSRDSTGCKNSRDRDHESREYVASDEEDFQERNLPKKARTNSHSNKKAVPIMKSEKKIATSYTPFAFAVHLIIIGQHLHTLYTTPSTSVSSFRLTSFTQLVYVTTTCFHIATLLANLFKKCRLERAFVLYGTWVIWTGWAMCLCLINPSNKPDALLSNTLSLPPTTTTAAATNSLNSVLLNKQALQYPIFPRTAIAPFLMHGNWASTTFPIISFLLILVIRRNHWGLITWEHLALLDLTNSLKWYRLWCIAGAGAGWMLTWEAAKFWFHVPFSFIDYGGALASYRTDIPVFPGLFSTLCTSCLSGTLMMCWWSFWTFQYRGVVWKRELVEGVAVWSADDGLIRVGGVG